MRETIESLADKLFEFRMQVSRMNPRIDFQDRLAGLLIGTAVGDAIGLPREGMSARRVLRLFGGSPLSHRFPSC